MSEANLWDRMRKGLTDPAVTSALSTPLCLDRVENAVLAGMADVNGCCEMKEFWLELKFITDKPKRDGKVFGKNGLRKEQIPWLYERARAGSRVFIFAQVEKALVLVHGIHAREFNDWDIATMGERARWKHYGASPDWLSLLRSIQSP